MAGLDIAFFGSSLVSAYWNGAATYYRGIIRALAAHGHRITFYEPDAYDRQKHRDMDDPPWARVVVYEADEASALRALELARGADVLVKASGVGVNDALLEAALPDVAGTGALKIFWDVDAPATLARMRKDEDDPFRAQVARYDMVLTYGGGQPVVDAYGRFGARLCVPIYNALDPETHHPVPAAPRFAADLGFMASRLPDRERRCDAFFFKAAELAPGRRFLLGGNGWDGKPMSPNVRYVGHVYTRDHNALNCSALAVLNVTRDSMAETGFSPPTRVFEAAGAGACLVTDAWEGIEMFLEPGTEVLVARDGAEVAAHVEALTPERSRRIGEAARRRMLAEHTYAHRAGEVVALLTGTADHPVRRTA
ncbi:CgeB family protein [Arenibaculum pallidiluteum]|uniref:CgeB family protein n=1 Tax=Arenibaculum pallidiluteum TaxID=2812559 RepID=UPI001A97315D|nr:glycosyltransferase [Arenibaculum pallidiluteum]